MQPLPPFNPQMGSSSSLLSTSQTLVQTSNDPVPDALMQHIDNTALVQQWRERQQKQKQKQQQQQQASQPPPPPMYYIDEPPRPYRMSAGTTAQEELNNNTLYQLQRLQLQQPQLQLQLMPQPSSMPDYGAGAMVPGLWPPAAKPGPVDGRRRMSASLYVKNLPLNADKLFLYERFAPFGAILSVKVLTDEETGRCRGVGFVNYLERSVAIFAANALQGSRIDGKPLHVALQEPRQT